MGHIRLWKSISWSIYRGNRGCWVTPS